MSFLDLKREWKIRMILRQLAKQRVGLVLQPGNVWVIEKAVEDNEETDAALKTCYMRGWVEPLENSVPKGKIKRDGSLPDGNLFESSGPIWKLTDSGWAAINRAHEWTTIGILIGAVGVIVALST
ncbi:hypothetical protein ACFL2E_05070 [Thermodesulfobacteriota bacterium]